MNQRVRVGNWRASTSTVIIETVHTGTDASFLLYQARQPPNTAQFNYRPLILYLSVAVLCLQFLYLPATIIIIGGCLCAQIAHILTYSLNMLSFYTNDHHHCHWLYFAGPSKTALSLSFSFLHCPCMACASLSGSGLINCPFISLVLILSAAAAEGLIEI